MNLDKLIICQQARKDLGNYLQHPSQALLLTGPSGAGLRSIAVAMAKRLAGNDVLVLAPMQHDKQKTEIINADDMSQLEGLVRDKRQSPFAIVMDDIDKTAPGLFEHMLKLVEEPVVNLYYIFTTHNLPRIPQTIMSRTAIIRVGLPTREECRELYVSIPAVQAKQIGFAIGRQPALIVKLLSHPDEMTERLSHIGLAKEFLQSDSRRRLEIIDGINDRQVAIEFINDVAMLYLTVAESGQSLSRKFSQNTLLMSDIAERLVRNGSAKIQLIDLALNL